MCVRERERERNFAIFLIWYTEISFDQSINIELTLITSSLRPSQIYRASWYSRKFHVEVTVTRQWELHVTLRRNFKSRRATRRNDFVEFFC